jgi:type IV pilus assembly protein PilW
MRSLKSNSKGFTLVELMVTMAISSIVMAGIYAAYQAQVRSHVTQQTVIDIQQNIRSSMHFMQHSIRMAGYDPVGVPAADIGFQANFMAFGPPHDASGATTDGNSIAFTMNIGGGQFDGVDNDGDAAIDEADESEFSDSTINVTSLNELIAFRLNGNDLERWMWVGPAPDAYGWRIVADRIDAISFRYFDNSTPVPLELVPPLAAADLDNIRSVEITIIAQPVEEMARLATAKRSQSLTAQVRCRNL